MRDNLMVRAADFGIVLEDIAITHLSFGTEFTKVREGEVEGGREMEMGGRENGRERGINVERDGEGATDGEGVRDRRRQRQGQTVDAVVPGTPY